jgi:hypothetical protein
MTLINSAFDSSMTLADIDWLRSEWSGEIVVKGVQRLDDAVEIVHTGVEAIAISNHGGRQLDRAGNPLELLPSVVDAVGSEAEISFGRRRCCCHQPRGKGSIHRTPVPLRTHGQWRGGRQPPDKASR